MYKFNSFVYTTKEHFCDNVFFKVSNVDFQIMLIETGLILIAIKMETRIKNCFGYNLKRKQ